MTYASLIKQTLTEIENELKARGNWHEPVSLTNMDASVSFPAWLQSVYLPSMHASLAKNRLPLFSAVGPVAQKHFKRDHQLVNLCLPLARMDYYINRQIGTLVDELLAPHGDDIDSARVEALNDLMSMSENSPNSVYNVAVMLVVSYGQELYSGTRNEAINRALSEAEVLCRWVNTYGTEFDNEGRRMLHESAAIQLGQILYFQKRFDEAEECLHQGMHMNPHNGTWLTCADTLARIYMERSEVDEAIPVLQRLVEFHPAYVPGHTKLKACVDFRAQADANAKRDREVEAVTIVGARVHQLSVDLQEGIKNVMASTLDPQGKVAEIQKLQTVFQENMTVAMRAA